MADEVTDVVQEEIKQKGYTITRLGRQLIARSLATHTPMVWTGIMIGRGVPPGDVELPDVEALADPVAAGTSTMPQYLKDRVNLTVEFRSDMVPAGMDGFYITEFGIFGKLEGDEEEILFVYGCQGDYPVWVGQYTDGCTDIRRWPIALVIGSGLNVSTGYSPASFMTAEDIAEYTRYVLLPQVAAAHGAIWPVDILLLPDAWELDDDSKYRIRVPVAEAREELTAIGGLDPEQTLTAGLCGISPYPYVGDQYIEFRADRQPEELLRARMFLVRPGTKEALSLDYTAIWRPSELQPATANRLGGIKVGDGLSVAADGTVSATGDGAREATEEEIIDALNSSETNPK